ncbi:hypothetical protein GCM10023142_37490 [Anaerocolumna aminovalerica]|uniref:Uncharacterized protein n=1 Tax=Anaerocolumna aminovalerica TaxID=1527 RepID=A0A1I5CWL1_9FIRM|nr:DUF5688 family protein [Anaerocolumna aminovalerica]SFN91395.1 hypothetical protein SAMN04489757_10475 [Anaerocolumna aminovalerica]
MVGTDVAVERKTVRKNNGVVLDTILMYEKENPYLYFNYYFEQYKQGATESEIIEDMLKDANVIKEEAGERLQNATEVSVLTFSRC